MDSRLLKEDTIAWWIDRMFLQDALKAAVHSVDPNTQVGSVLVVPKGGVLLSSYNNVPPTIKLTNTNLLSKSKNFCTEHAERSVLFKALKNALPVDGLHLYCTWAACAECSRAIIDFGIRRVVTFRKLVEKTNPNWQDSVLAGLQMMNDSGIELVGWSGDIGIDVPIRFGGNTINRNDLM